MLPPNRKGEKDEEHFQMFMPPVYTAPEFRKGLKIMCKSLRGKKGVEDLGVPRLKCVHVCQKKN